MEIIYKEKLSSEFRERIYEGFNRQAAESRGLKPMESIALEMLDDRGKVIAAAVSDFEFGAIHIYLLYIEKTFRKKGYGEELLKRVEKWGKDKGARFATLDTFDFQARHFYERCGYEVEFVRKGYDKGSLLYKMRKDFSHMSLNS